VGGGACAGRGDFLGSGVCIFLVEVYDAHYGAFLRESSRDGASDAAGGARYDSDFAVKA
jgi:hypothetical protein